MLIVSYLSAVTRDRSFAVSRRYNTFIADEFRKISQSIITVPFVKILLNLSQIYKKCNEVHLYFDILDMQHDISMVSFHVSLHS